MYTADEKRYDTMRYNRCGRSGLKLPVVSLGLWHNFGDFSSYDNMKQMCFTAFDHGITHFDLANNYGLNTAAQRSTSDLSLRSICRHTATSSLSAQRQAMICGRDLTATGAAASI